MCSGQQEPLFENIIVPNSKRSGGSLNDVFYDMYEHPTRYADGYEIGEHSITVGNDERTPMKPSDWVQRFINIKGKRMSFALYPYQKQVIDDMHPKQCVEKAAQLGFSQIMLSKVFWFCDYNIAGPSGKVIYTFPTFTDMCTYSAARIPPIINDSTCITDEDYGYDLSYEDEPTAYIQTMMDADSAKLKKIRDTFLFLKGTIGDNSAISIDSDWNLHDEVNFSNANVLNKYRSRLGAPTSLGWEYRFSTPTIPGYGVSKDFQESDQNWWYIKCPHCGKKYRLDFDRNIVELAYGKGYIYKCHVCGKEITPETRAKGFYVAEAPDVKDLRGYHVDKMCNPNISANDLVKSKEAYKRVADFYNFDLGLSYTEKTTALSREILQELYTSLGATYTMSAFAKWTDEVTMGVDQGDTLWVEIAGTDPVTGKRKLLYAEKVDSSSYEDEDAFQRLPELITRYKVQTVVIDALPNKTSSRWLRNFYHKDGSRTKVYIAYYTNTRDGDINADDEKRVVNIDRTETFKWTFNRIHTGEFAIPSGSDIMELWMDHMCNLKKESIEDEYTGDVKEMFVKTGPDHFNHAHLYCEVANQILQKDKLKISSNGGVAPMQNQQWSRRPGYSTSMDGIGGRAVVPRRRR